MGIQCIRTPDDLSRSQGGMKLSTRNIDELSNVIMNVMRIEFRMKTEGFPQEIFASEKLILANP